MTLIKPTPYGILIEYLYVGFQFAIYIIINSHKMSERELRSSLLDIKKLDTFQKYNDECIHRIKRIKQRNDSLQRSAGTEHEDQIAIEVKRQKEFMETEIQELKDMIEQMKRKYKDNTAKNKIRDIQKDAQKQILRNRDILRDFINKSFLNVENVRKSRGDVDQEEQGQYFEGGKANINTEISDVVDQRNGQTNGHSNGFKRHQNQDDHHGGNRQSEMDVAIDYELEDQINKQKNVLLQEVEQTMQNVNNIMNDIALKVDEDGKNLDIITDNVMETNKNVATANTHMESANDQQKKARKKTIWIVAIIVVAVLLVGGLIWIFAK